MLEECVITLDREFDDTMESKLANVATNSLDFLRRRPDISAVSQDEVI